MWQISRIFILLYIKDNDLSDAVFLTERTAGVGPCQLCHYGMASAGTSWHQSVVPGMSLGKPCQVAVMLPRLNGNNTSGS